MPARTSLMLGWLALLAASAALFMLVALVAWWQHRRQVPSRSRRRAERAEWAQHATALAERARQAVAMVAEARAAVATAERERAAAWAALEAAEAAHDEAANQHAEAVRRSGGNGLPAGQPREVTHAALAAYRRGDLTKEQLWRVWQWGSGWDPEVDRCERELYRLRADRRAAHQRYQAAADHERDVLAAADLAEVQARALTEEVVTASEEAGWDDGLRAQLS